MRLIQDRRKDLNLDFADRIAVQLAVSSQDLGDAIDENCEYITKETLAVQLEVLPLTDDDNAQAIGDFKVVIQVRKSS